MAYIKQLPLGPLQTNCYILACEETKSAAVIDPSYDGQAIEMNLLEDGLTLTHLLITHSHFDHVGGLGYLKQANPDVPIYIHPDASGELLFAAQQAAMFGLDFPATPPADKMINEGDVIEVGSLKLDVLYTPGHAPGHISFHLPSHGVIFSGDLLFKGSVGRTDLPGGSFQVLIESIENKLMVLNDDTQVLSGHGPVTKIGVERTTNMFLQ